MTLFTASEIIELGILIEKNGREFYQAAAEKSRSAEAQKLFTYLADQEREHEKVFVALRDNAGSTLPPEDTPEEYFAYLEALSREHVFTEQKGADIAARTRSDREVLDLALGFEKDSILLYQEMKNFVHPGEHPVLDGLIAAERGHVLTLIRLKRELPRK